MTKNYHQRPMLFKLTFMTFFCFILQANVVFSQNKVDFGIFVSSPGLYEIRIKPNYMENGTAYLTNSQFSVKWPVSSGITALVSGTPVFPMMFTPQGAAYTDNGFFYQVWATPGGDLVSWTANQELVVQTFAADSAACVLFEIAHDTFVQNVINGDYYIEINGNPDLTGILYQASDAQFIGSAGMISGQDTVYATNANIIYSIPAVSLATSYTWAYSGTGATISGTDSTVSISFSAGATSGFLTVAGHNAACGDGPVSPPFPITVLTDAGIINPESPWKQHIDIYPNPSGSDAISLKFEGVTNSEARLEITNILSGIQKTYPIQAGNYALQPLLIDIAELQSGIYFVKIELAGKLFTGKLIRIKTL